MLSRSLKAGLAVGLLTIVSVLASCHSSDECNPHPFTHQCVEAATLWAEFPDYFRAAVGIELGGASDAGTTGTSQLRCPTLRELQYELINPYAVNLQGESFISEPESDSADGVCCYTTTAYCE